MLAVQIILFVILLIYVKSIISFMVVWRKAPNFDLSNTSDAEPMSVIVPVHNELDNMNPLLLSMLKQSTDFDDLIFVCDHCTDGTDDNLRRLTRDYRQVRVVDNPLPQGKKQAIRHGVSLARHATIAMIDADCEIQESWCKALKTFHTANHPNMLIAPVAMRADDTFMGHLFEIEFLAIQFCTAGAALAGYPILCNGANLSFDKTTYQQHDCHSEYVSGDDMFLLSEVKKNKGKISFIKNAGAMVSTVAPRTLSEYLRQRTRWLRKSTGYTDWQLIAFSVLIFLANMIWPAFAILAIWSVDCGICAAAAFVLKLIADFALLLKGRNFWNIRVRFRYAFVLSVLYPFIILIICTLSLFRSKRKWK